MKKVFSFIGIIVGTQFIVSAPAIAQGPDALWTKTYGGTDSDYGYSVQECASGGFIIAGETGFFGSYDVYLIRTKANGDTLWTRTYGGTDSEDGYSVQECASGGFIIAGETESFGAGKSDVYLIRTKANGDTLWTQTYGGTSYDYGLSVQQCASGGFIIAGGTWSFGAGTWDVYLVRTKANGDTLWTKTYGGTDWDGGYSVEECADGGFIIAGSTSSFGDTLGDVYLVRTKANGDTLWTRTYGGTDWDFGKSVQECADGGFIIAGSTSSFGDTLGDVYLVRTKANGDTLWTKTYGGTNRDYGESVQECASGGFIIAGNTGSFGAGDGDVWLIRIDSDGDTLWTKTYGGTNGDYGYSVQECAGGGFIIAGWTWSFGAGSGDVYLIRTEAISICLTSPDGGENWEGGTNQLVRWDVYNYGFKNGCYRLIYTKNVPGWGTMPCSLSSPHPYPNNCDTIWIISHPGAEKMRLYFDTLVTDPAGDYVYIYDKQDNLIDTYDGVRSAFWTSEIPGDTVKIRLKSDGNIQKYGFDIDKYDVYVSGSEDYLDTIATGIELDSTSYLWELPNGNFPLCKVKIQILDSLSNVVFEDKSDAAFSILKTGVEERNERLEIRDWRLQIYPNPSFGNALIKYGVPEKANMTLRLYDISGRLVKTIYAGTQEKGYYEVGIKQDEMKGGIYFIRFETNEFKATKKLTIIR